MAEREEVQVQPLEREEREEQPALVTCDEAHRPADLLGVDLQEADRVDLDVGVLADTVRVRVVPGVLRAPPVAAHPHDAVADDEAQHVVRAAGLEDRAVGRFVGEERDLREQDAERRGDQKLEPAVTQEDETGDRSREAERDRGRDQDVEPRGPLQQTCLTHHLGHLGVGLGDGREALLACVRLTDAAHRGLGCGECSDLRHLPIRGIPLGRNGRRRKTGADRFHLTVRAGLCGRRNVIAVSSPAGQIPSLALTGSPLPLVLA